MEESQTRQRAMMSKLKKLRRKQMKCYSEYREGKMSSETYLAQMRPIDERIDVMEMATLRGTLGVKEACAPYIRKQETPEESVGRSAVLSLPQ